MVNCREYRILHRLTYDALKYKAEQLGGYDETAEIIYLPTDLQDFALSEELEAARKAGTYITQRKEKKKHRFLFSLRARHKKKEVLFLALRARTDNCCGFLCSQPGMGISLGFSIFFFIFSSGVCLAPGAATGNITYSLVGFAIGVFLGMAIGFTCAGSCCSQKYMAKHATTVNPWDPKDPKPLKIAGS